MKNFLLALVAASLLSVSGARAQNSAAPIESWNSLRSIIADPKFTHGEKSAAIDQLFASLAEFCAQGGEGMVGQVLKRFEQDINSEGPSSLVSALKSAKEQLFDKENEGEPNIIQKFVTKIDGTISADRVRIALNLLRQIIALEERHVFTLVNDSGDRPLQFQALADLLSDLNYLGRQGLAIGRMIKVGFRVQQNFKDKNWDERRELFDRVYPDIVRASDEFGVYYVKFLQSLSALIFHFDAESFAKLDKILGKSPRQMSFEQVKSIIEADLGRPIEQAYTSIEREPFANGSMGQVHWASVNGTPVVVKVQKPFAERELKWNLTLNSLLFRTVEGATPEKMRWVVELFTQQAEQLGEAFLRETDSPAEAARQRRFRRLLSNVEHHQIPRVFSSHVGARVLTVEAVENAKRIHEMFEISLEAEPQQPKMRFAKEKPLSKRLKFNRIRREEDDETEEAELTDSPAPTTDDSPLKMVVKLMHDYGYRLKPTYFQLTRSLLPILGMSLQFSKLQAQYEAMGKNGFDLELQQLDQVRDAFERSVVYQLLIMKELHADYNWGNVLIDPSANVHLIDFGQNVKTRGLLLSPAFLVLGFFKGDAKLIFKKLEQLGSFRDVEQNRDEILKHIQLILTQQKIVKRSWFSLARKSYRVWRERPRTIADAEKTLVKKKDSGLGKETTQAFDSALSGNKPPPVPYEADRAPAMVAGFSIAGKVARTLATYPYHRARVLLLETSLCQRLLDAKDSK